MQLRTICRVVIYPSLMRKQKVSNNISSMHIYPVAGISLPWYTKAIHHSQNACANIQTEIIPLELDRIKRYTEKGDLCKLDFALTTETYGARCRNVDFPIVMSVTKMYKYH